MLPKTSLGEWRPSDSGRQACHHGCATIVTYYYRNIKTGLVVCTPCHQKRGIKCVPLSDVWRVSLAVGRLHLATGAFNNIV